MVSDDVSGGSQNGHDINLASGFDSRPSGSESHEAMQMAATELASLSDHVLPTYDSGLGKTTAESGIQRPAIPSATSLR